MLEEFLSDLGIIHGNAVTALVILQKMTFLLLVTPDLVLLLADIGFALQLTLIAEIPLDVLSTSRSCDRFDHRLGARAESRQWLIQLIFEIVWASSNNQGCPLYLFWRCQVSLCLQISICTNDNWLVASRVSIKQELLTIILFSQLGCITLSKDVILPIVRILNCRARSWTDLGLAIISLHTGSVGNHRVEYIVLHAELSHVGVTFLVVLLVIHLLLFLQSLFYHLVVVGHHLRLSTS